jgi:hypothetical protein
MLGTIIDIINGGSIWLLVVGLHDRVVEQPIEPRYWADSLDAENLSEPADLVGRDVELSDDGMSISFGDEADTPPQ